MTGRSSRRSGGPARIDGVSIAEFMARQASAVPSIRAEYHRREGYRIIVRPGIWRGYDVEIEPPTCTHPLRGFKTLALAVEHAEAVSQAEGWPIVVTGDDDGGRAA